VTDAGADSGSDSASGRIELLTRPGCSLCTTAREVVQRIAADEGVGWHERNVDDDPDLADEYGDRVPVVLVDGAEHAYWRVDERRLRDALHGRRSW
jgi:glutaredoxin